MALCCPICDDQRGETIVATERMFGLPGNFRYRHCSQCGCLYLIDEPDDLKQFYPDNYYSFQKSTASIVRKLRARVYLSKASFLVDWRPRSDLDVLKVAKFDKSKTLLDVGCGAAARLVNDLRGLGYNAIGADPYIESNIYDESGLSVMKTTIDKIDGKFDVILFRHSLEHMSSPREVIKKARLLLPAKGVCIVCVPVIGWAWEHYGVNWVQLEAPRHFCLYTEKAMAILAESADLSVVNTIFDSNEFQFWGSDALLNGRLLAQCKPPGGNERKKLRRKAHALNRQRRGDAAQFFLTPKA